MVVAHRRAGKTVACINELVKTAITTQLDNARFGYVGPFYNQTKTNVWDYLKFYTSVIPDIKTNEQELRVDFPNGARIRLFGADNADRLRGQYFDGLVADEYGDWKPSVWAYVIRPALADRRGWAIIIGTPKGRNQFYETYQNAITNPKWLDLCIKASESGLLHPEELESLKEELTEDAWRQEMECDFDAALPGAIYGAEMKEIMLSGRIRPDVYDPNLDVHVTMDLGRTDDTTILWYQVKDGLRLIDAYHNNHKDVQHFDDILKAKKYKYGKWLWLPHDAKAQTLASPRSVEMQFRELGWRVRIVPNLSIVDGINAARLTFKTLIMDGKLNTAPHKEEGKSTTVYFCNALKQYQREYDEDKKCFKATPRHDWTSHYADVFRYACIAWREDVKPVEDEPVRFPQDRTINELIAEQTRRRLSDD